MEKIADFNLSENPALAVQRDIFVFQCLIGCRVSDLMRMTDNSVIDGAVEYIPDKTKGERLEVLRVPLNNRAKEILSRYADYNKGNMLLPFISPQKYNDAIKKIFTRCGITRIVTVLNPTTAMKRNEPSTKLQAATLPDVPLSAISTRRSKTPILSVLYQATKRAVRLLPVIATLTRK